MTRNRYHVIHGPPATLCLSTSKANAVAPEIVDTGQLQDQSSNTPAEKSTS